MTEVNLLPLVEDSSVLLAEIIKAMEAEEDIHFIQNYQEADLANILESVNDQYRRLIIEVIAAQRYWVLLNFLKFETAKHIHQSLSEELATERLLYITENDVIAFADFLADDFVDEFLLTQSSETVAHIQQALSYDDDQVGRYGEPCFLVANAKNSVGRIKNEILKQVDSPIRLIIVRDTSGIIGTVDPETLLVHDRAVRLRELAVITPVLEDVQDIYEVCKQVSIDGNANWFPVLSEGKVMGIMSMTTIALTLRELSLQSVMTENVGSEEDLFTPLKVAARLRGLWLVINLLTAFIASAIIGVFENVVDQVVALAILMPVVASMGGIAGSQTLAVALRGIALNHLHRSNLNLLLNKEVKIACLNGVIMGAAIATIVYFIFNSLSLALIIFCAIWVNSLAAALSGTLIPFMLNKLKIDPAVAGSVILTTVTDVIGFLVFLGLGAIFLV
jgi:Mg/Co/Ni transporter MgtE